MKLLEQYRQHRWDRIAIAGAMFPVVFVALVIGLGAVLDGFRSHGFNAPNWAVVIALMAFAQAVFTLLAWLGIARRLPRRMVRHALLQFICLPITGAWFLCLCAYARLTSSGW